MDLHENHLLILLGAAAVAGYAIHGAAQVRRGEPDNLLWTCHLGAVLVGAGLIAGEPLPVAVGVEWLVLGNLLWAVELRLGGEFLPTSLLTHVLGLAAGLAGVRSLGVPARSWTAAVAGLVLLFAVTWLVVPVRSRVNLVHGIRAGLERYVLGSYPLYLAAVFALCLAVASGTEFALVASGFAPAR